ncbi:MAG: CehA/McbA family metallohydrolase [Pseudomonadota bacterium]
MFDTFTAPGQFWRGNIHGHSTNSDGALSPEEVCAAYRAEGYDFICLSDHFLERFGFPISDTTAYRSKGFTTILGAEVHAPSTSRDVEWHILAVGLPADFPATTADETGLSLAQRCADAGAFVAVAHPAWYNLELEDALALEAAHAVEVYNHTCSVRTSRGDGAAMWDGMLSAGRRVLGIAVDDSHWHDDAPDGFGGWVMVKAERNDPGALLDALKAGRFYATQGPEIMDIKRVDDTLELRCSPATQVFAVGPVATAVHASGISLTRATLPLTQFDDTWCRVVVRDAMGRQAWTNPIWLD